MHLLTAVVLFIAAPSLLQVLELQGAVEGLAADGEVVAAPVLLVCVPLLKALTCGVALELLGVLVLPAELAMLFAAKALVLFRPSSFMWILFSVTIEGHTSGFFLTAAPCLFLRAPQLVAVTQVKLTIEMVAGHFLMRAAPALLFAGPHALPARSVLQLAAVGLGRVAFGTPTEMRVAAPSLLLFAPLALPLAKIFSTVKVFRFRSACTALLLLDAAIGPLGIAPMGVHLIFFVVTVVSATASLVVVAAPALLFGTPLLMGFTFAMKLLAATSLIVATPGLLG